MSSHIEVQCVLHTGKLNLTLRNGATRLMSSLVSLPSCHMQWPPTFFDSNSPVFQFLQFSTSHYFLL